MNDEAKRVVESLLDDESPDPKEFVDQNLQPKDIVSVAFNSIINIPFNSGETDTMQVYAQIRAIVDDMVQKLEQMTGRKALDGLRELFVAAAPKPWNYQPGEQIKPARAREAVATFRNSSKPVKQ